MPTDFTYPQDALKELHRKLIVAMCESSFRMVPNTRGGGYGVQNVSSTIVSLETCVCGFFLGLPSPLCSKLMAGSVITVNNTTRWVCVLTPLDRYICQLQLG